ncbi:unnamed protein product, partial [Prorocentrum cordatum]
MMTDRQADRQTDRRPKATADRAHHEPLASRTRARAPRAQVQHRSSAHAAAPSAQPAEEEEEEEEEEEGEEEEEEEEEEKEEEPPSACGRPPPRTPWAPPGDPRPCWPPAARRARPRPAAKATAPLRWEPPRQGGRRSPAEAPCGRVAARGRSAGAAAAR